MKRQRIKYKIVKLPSTIQSYFGNETIDRFLLPKYTTLYLKKRAKILFDVLYKETPSPLYKELVELIKIKENLQKMKHD